MKKTYITPELEETLIQTDNVLAIIPTSPGDTSGYTEDNPIKAESKGFNEFSMEDQYIWE